MNYNYLTKINIMDKFTQFQDAIEINKVSDSLYKIIPSENFFVGSTPHGGYLMAIMHKALTSALPHSCAISSSIQYLDRTEPREIEIHVDVLRVSKGSSTGRVTIIQDDLVKCIYTGTCSDFEHMRGYNGLSTPAPEIFKTADKKDINKAVVHCFTGTQKELDEYLNYDFYIGLTGWICDERRNKDLRASIKDIPLNKLMLETDSPYLIPRNLDPKPKSNRNEPKNLFHIATEIAKLRNESVDEICNATYQNSINFFSQA